MTACNSGVTLAITRLRVSVLPGGHDAGTRVDTQHTGTDSDRPAAYPRPVSTAVGAQPGAGGTVRGAAVHHAAHAACQRPGCGLSCDCRRPQAAHRARRRTDI